VYNATATTAAGGAAAATAAAVLLLLLLYYCTVDILLPLEINVLKTIHHRHHN
jgi:hypothetical protein